ncbi:MAG: hypothetical protein MRY32_07105 [Rickettsiales bacterium]|nr:hypothetical protein [Rickettsiales bacterium]
MKNKLPIAAYFASGFFICYFGFLPMLYFLLFSEQTELPQPTASTALQFLQSAHIISPNSVEHASPQILHTYLVAFTLGVLSLPMHLYAILLFRAGKISLESRESLMQKSQDELKQLMEFYQTIAGILIFATLFCFYSGLYQVDLVQSKSAFTMVSMFFSVLSPSYLFVLEFLKCQKAYKERQ